MKKVNVNLGYHQYDIIIDKNLNSRIIRFINGHTNHNKVLFLLDRNFYSQQKIAIDQIIDGVNNSFRLMINASEKNKTYSSVIKIHEFMQRKKFGRDSLLVAVGGGITGDIGGFAASIYMRGIPYIQIPTTLLAAVDSSVGGKTGINLNTAKNFIGSFYQPEAVFIDVNFFNTLPFEERLCGLGEILKYGFLTEKRIFNYLKKNGSKILELDSTAIKKIVAESVKYKSSVVIADERESGIRKLLNLGHTFAHAFEMNSKHKIKHGHAVIIGLVAAVRLAKNLELVSEKNYMEFLSLLLPYSEYIKLKNAGSRAVYKSMFSDKKTRGGKLKFVLPVEIGKILIDVEADKKGVLDAIQFSLEYFS